jgi:hypothetical protein
MRTHDLTISCRLSLSPRRRLSRATIRACWYWSVPPAKSATIIFITLAGINTGDLLVCERTRVIPARLFGRKIPGGGRVEVLLLRQMDEKCWECLVGARACAKARSSALKTDRGHA